MGSLENGDQVKPIIQDGIVRIVIGLQWIGTCDTGRVGHNKLEMLTFDIVCMVPEP